MKDYMILCMVFILLILTGCEPGTEETLIEKQLAEKPSIEEPSAE